MNIKPYLYSNFICDKWYNIIYKVTDGIERFMNGYIINYNSGNVIALNENGVYHIPYKYIIYMEPIKNTDKIKRLEEKLEEKLGVKK